MFCIIETQEEFDNFLDTIKDQIIICVPIMSDIRLHYVHDYLSLLYVREINSINGVILCFNHSESLSISYENLHVLFQSVSNAYIYDLKCILQYCNYKHVYDLDLVQYFKTNTHYNESDYNTNVHEYFYSKYYKLHNVNYLIPITKHYERCEDFINKVIPDLIVFDNNDAFKWYNIMYRQLSKIENVGLYINPEIFKLYFTTEPVNNLVYSEYNMYTTTGRPSNRFDGVNYAALNTTNEVRKSFISRYGDDGILMQLDYEAYHVRLLGNLVGYTFEDNINTHIYLGRQYFGKQELTESEYEESKKITFKLVYGRITPEFLKIPFFKMVSDYTEVLWTKMKLYGYIKTPIFGRILHKNFFTDLNPQKVLNYLLQAYETENNMYTLSKYLQANLTTTSKIILYTYDSFVIDLHKSEMGKVKDIKNIFEDDGKYPCTLQVGHNYDDLITIRTR